jgi:hypothetical protein
MVVFIKIKKKIFRFYPKAKGIINCKGDFSLAFYPFSALDLENSFLTDNTISCSIGKQQNSKARSAMPRVLKFIC